MKCPILPLLLTLLQMSRPGVSQPIITQDPGSVTGTEEGEVTVPCSVTGAPPGPVRWYRDTGSGRQYLYSTSPPPSSEINDPRVSQVHENHATDSSIRIVRLTLRDSGMYYCEKYGGIDVTLIARGSGSRLSVRALPPLIITQNPDSVTGTEEGQVTVPCTLSRVGAAGPVRWYRGTGSGRQYLYSTDPPPPNERNDPRVSRAYPMNPTDFSIRIVRLTVNDSGMYYCEKYRGIDETPIARGSGSRLSVRGPDPGSKLVIYVAVAGVVVLIVLLLAVGLYCRFHAGKKKAEIMRSPVLSIETHDKELTYASLDLQKKSNRRSMKIAESEVCAYAEIKGAKVRGAKASDDLTYASLDEANLKRKTKEPGGGGRGGEPPEKQTEYASVNFRKN